MNKLFTVISHEYSEVVRKKSFLIGVILTPVIMFGLIFLPTLFIDKETSEPIRFTLVDMGSGLLDEFRASFVGTLADGRPLFMPNFVNGTEASIELIKTELVRLVNQEEISFYIIIPKNIVETGYAERYGVTHGQFADVQTVKAVINRVVMRERLAAFNVPPDKVNLLTRDVDLDFIQIGREGEEGEGHGMAGLMSKYLSGIAFVMILFFSIIGYGQHLLRALLEEKNTRVIEVLVSSLTPNQIMMGKIIGLGAASLTQLLIWFVLGLAVSSIGARSAMLADVIANAQTLSIGFFLSFAVYFILGYFLYASLFAMFGSILSSEKDVQQTVGPINMVLILPIMLGMVILQNPNASWLVALSYVPLLTPTLMILRSSIAVVPTIQIYTTVAVLIVALGLTIWLSARIFRVGILMYGKRPTLPEMIKWIRYK